MQRLRWIVKTNTNFWDVGALRFSKKKRRITYRSGPTFEISWQEYCSIAVVLRYYGYNLREAYGLPCFIKDNMKLIVPLNYLPVLFELNNQIYDLDFKNKVVLDVGGFTGETAVYFASKGARKIIIYEPVPFHVELIKMNIKLNRVNADLHQEGVDKEDGRRIVHYETLGMTFGWDYGAKQMEIRTKDVKKVLDESHADIAKFDCEGTEETLLNVPNEILEKIPFYIIEVHSNNIRESIKKKFASANFHVLKNISPFAHYPQSVKKIGEISIIILSNEKYRKANSCTR